MLRKNMKQKTIDNLTSEDLNLELLYKLGDFFLNDASTHAAEFHRSAQLDNPESTKCYVYLHEPKTPIVMKSIPFVQMETKIILGFNSVVPDEIRRAILDTNYATDVLIMVGFPRHKGYVWYCRTVNVEKFKHSPPPGSKYTAARINTIQEIRDNPELYLNRSICGKTGCTNDSKFRCSKCLKIKYCCAECQKSDWARHKPVCFPVVKKNV